MTSLTVMGIDPGSTNAGIAIINVKIKEDRVKVYIKECGKLKNLLTDLKKPHRKELQEHVKEIRDLAKKYNVDFILAERYMSRGRNGATIEYVNQMLGAMEYGLSYEITQISASTWKNRINRVFDLKQFYKYCYRVEPHEVDAVFQAMWLAEKKLEIEFLEFFESDEARKNLKRVILCQTTSLLKKRKKQKKR